MTNPTNRKRYTRTPLAWLAGLTVLLMSILPSHAQVDVKYVTTFVGSSLSTDGSYSTVWGFISGSGSTEITAAPGVPSRTRTRYGISPDTNNFALPGYLEWVIMPTLTKPGAVYQIDVAHNSTNTAATSCSTDILISIFCPDGDLSPSCTNTPYFQRQYGGTNWWKIGYITNYSGVTQPNLHFFWNGGGTLNGASGQSSRLYIDAFRFTEVNPCTGVASQPTITGPLAANQTFVNVLNVDAAATNISVFADTNTFIGQKTSGIVGGSNQVVVTGLIQGQQIVATQTKNGCTSTLPVNGPIVGGGANPSVNAFLSCWSNSAYAGPIGTNSSIPASGVYYAIKGTGATGSQGAPLGGQQLLPGACWQTVTYDHIADSQVVLASATTFKNTDPFAAIDGLIFSIDTSGGTGNTGPYDIYVDQIMNGDTVIEDFESYAVGSVSPLNNPNSQGQFPNPAVAYVPSPNSSTISTNYAYAGSKSCRIRWQWLDNQTARWARIQFNATAGKNFPQVDTTKPITVRYLVLPAGQSADEMHFSTAPANQNVLVGQNATFSVVASGAGPFSYQWSKGGGNLSNGGNISGAQTSALTVSSAGVSDSGVYNVLVTEQAGSFCSGSIGASLNVSQSVAPSALSYTFTAPTTLNLSWSAGVLQSANTLLNSGTGWTDVGGATSPYQVPVTTQKYYRVRGQ
jgi:hypothetical protein